MVMSCRLPAPGLAGAGARGVGCSGPVRRTLPSANTAGLSQRPPKPSSCGQLWLCLCRPGSSPDSDHWWGAGWLPLSRISCAKIHAALTHAGGWGAAVHVARVCDAWSGDLHNPQRTRVPASQGSHHRGDTPGSTEMTTGKLQILRTLPWTAAAGEGGLSPNTSKQTILEMDWKKQQQGDGWTGQNSTSYSGG